ncbi:hypothetical protein SAMN07250955_102310 [Arboricoccus pini]|uniref:Ammonia monooxygenase n=1 Tax=Arboricoccus pini TaxID=1963835 RepID=A0A212QQN5_9PROT|nr:AbrB family transcriptional regulator [Arboricoccus pini]SNB61642.1 hypothetical protein SAMN07250955_102310 [Arboricoccus pini]
MRVPAIATWPRGARWAALLVVSLLLAYGLEQAGLPAALLLGPMFAGILLAVRGGAVAVPRVPYFMSQGVIGCLIASSITRGILLTFYADWPLFTGVVVTTLLLSALSGWLISRLRILPGTTAVWGSTPGGATAMVLMSASYGADPQLVAFMQYSRVLLVALTASLVARLWVDPHAMTAAPIVWFPPIEWRSGLELLLLVVVGAWLGRVLRLPAGPMLVPLVVGSCLNVLGLVMLDLPEWLLACSYMLVGWTIGLRFTGKSLRHAAHAMPQTLAATLILIAFCGALSWVLVQTVGLDPLTAYLATSPGGMDSVAIIAASSNVDMSFVMAFQTVRFVLVLMTGPALARLIARLVPPLPQPDEGPVH